MSNIFDSMLSGESSEKNSQRSDSQNESDHNIKAEIETTAAATASLTEASNTPRDVKEATQELLRRFVSESHDPFGGDWCRFGAAGFVAPA